MHNTTHKNICGTPATDNGRPPEPGSVARGQRHERGNGKTESEYFRSRKIEIYHA
jgi:hypothetical protein